MNKFAEQIIKWRTLIIISTILLTFFFGFGLTKLEINSDITSYLKPDDPAMILFNRIGDEYGGNHMVMVALRSDNIISYQTLTFLNELSEKYSKIEGVSSITSLINIIDIKSTDFGLEVGKLIDKNNIPENKDDLQLLRDYILSKDTYRGKIISEDGTTTLIICRLNPSFNKSEVAEDIKDLTETSRGDYEVFYSGFPLQMVELNRAIGNDLKTLIPIVIAVILMVLYFSFKTLRGVICPLSIVIISTIWTMGLMGYTNTPLSILSNVIPVILLALGTAYGIHFLSRYYEDINSESTKIKDIKKTVRHIGIPILLTAVTTIAGFLSFTGAYIKAISEFGIYTAFGVLIAMILSLTFLPAVLSLLKVKAGKGSNDSKHPFKRIMNKTAGFVLKNEKLIIIISLIIVVLSAAIIPRIKPETAITNFFPKRSDIRKADSVIKNNFGGSIPIQIVVNGNIKDPVVLKNIILMEKYLEQLPFVNNTQSLADLISQMNNIINNHETIPETREEVANLLFLLEGDEILEQMVNGNYTEGIIQATFGIEDSKILKDTLKKIDTYISHNINNTFIKISRESLDFSQNSPVDNWVYDLVSQSIYFDTKQFDFDKNIDMSAIKRVLKDLHDNEDILLTNSIKNALYDDLEIFFEEESEVYIDSQVYIESTVHALVAYAENNKAIQKEINATLSNIIPEKYWISSPESISNTGKFVYSKIINAQNESAIENISNLFIAKLYPRFINNKDFTKMIRDDLWLLTENSFAIPESLLKNPGTEYEKITIKAELSGMIKIINHLNDSLIKSQIQSIIIAIIVVFIILSLQFKSIKMGAVVLSPIILVILINFAIMGYMNIPLDYATMLVGSILIGVGIDYSIHFSSRFRVEYKNGQNERKSLEKTLKTTGLAIVANALMVALGFFVLIGGNIIPVKREGWMIGVLMMISAFAALVYLPSLILILKRFLRLNNKN